MTTFTVPLPLRDLSSNGAHGHWTKTAKARAEYRLESSVHAANPLSFRPVPNRVRLSLTFCIKGGRAAGRYQPRDASNALSAFKSGIDGLVDAGMCPDDSRKHLTLGAIEIDSKRGPFVECTVEVLE